MQTTVKQRSCLTSFMYYIEFVLKTISFLTIVGAYQSYKTARIRIANITFSGLLQRTSVDTEVVSDAISGVAVELVGQY